MKWKTWFEAEKERKGEESDLCVSSFHELRNIFGFGFFFDGTYGMCACLCVFVKVGQCSRSRH